MAKADANDKNRQRQHKKASQGSQQSLLQVCAGLCERERQVVFYSSLGLPHKEIAEKLQVSPHFVKSCLLAAEKQGWSNELACELREAVVSGAKASLLKDSPLFRWRVF